MTSHFLPDFRARQTFGGPVVVVGGHRVTDAELAGDAVLLYVEGHPAAEPTFYLGDAAELSFDEVGAIVRGIQP